MKRAISSYVILFIVAAALVLWAKIFPITGDEMGYAVIAWIIVFPIASLVLSFLAALDGVGYGLLCTFLSAAGSLIMPLIVFGATGREYMLIPVVGSVLGVAAGLAASRAIHRRK